MTKPGLYEYSERFTQSWLRAPRDEAGLVAFDVPGLGTRLQDLLDQLADVAADPTLLDYLGDRFLSLIRRAGLEPGPKIDAHGFNAEKGFKFSIQGGIGTNVHLRCTEEKWPERVAVVLDVFDQLEDLRKYLFLLVVNTIDDPWWPEKRQSIRGIRYFPGLHSPQAEHTDRPVVAVVVLPPGDDYLMVQNDEGSWQTVKAGSVPKAILIPGTAAAQVIPGAQALNHMVAPLRNRACRDVATLFLG